MLCTQALPVSCTACFPSSYPLTPQFDHLDYGHVPDSYFSPRTTRRPSVAPQLSNSNDSERCASCSISLPNNSRQPGSGLDLSFLDGSKNQVPMRTKEDVHICTNLYTDADCYDLQYRAPISHSNCHRHELEYVSSSTPVEADAFSGLRRATIRTLSGEQLPKGQTSGPLFFGNTKIGYTAAYVFRLTDSHARGQQRHYALLAQLGKDTKRALEASTSIWSAFENVAMSIIRMAQEVVSKTYAKEDKSPSERNHITPISSFLTQRTMDPDGFPRRGVLSVRANGLVELVDNDNFFCELHVTFVSVLRELGGAFGGLRIQPVEASETLVEVSNHSGVQDENINVSHAEEDDLQMSPSQPGPQHAGFSEPTPPTSDRYQLTGCAPNIVTQRSQVMV